MADYCTLAEALSLLPGIGTPRDAATGPPAVTATVPSAAQCSTLLASVTAEIDMHLRGQGYVAPATDTEAQASLKTICMNGAAARIGAAKYPGAAPDSAQGSIIENFRADYKAGLDFIDSGGLSQDAGSGGATSIAHGMTEYNPPHTMADYGFD